MTNVLKILVAGPVALLACVASGSGYAAGPELGCFLRDYSDAHLAKQPAQVVDRMMLSVHPVGDDIFATMWVDTARQGHALKSGHGGKRMMQYLLCWRNAGKLQCDVECDGGRLTVTKASGKSMTFRTDYLMVGGDDGCGGIVDLAEVPGKPVSYRLNRVSESVCGIK